jgi:UPF0755 protein
MADSKSRKLSRTSKLIIALVGVILFALGLTGLNYYLRYNGPNVTDNQKYLYIRTGSTIEDVLNTIKEQKMVKDTTTFRWAAFNMDYPGQIKPGKYRLEQGMSNRKLVNMLKAGNQEPVKLRFQNIRLKKDFANYISTQIEADSTALLHLLDSTGFVDKYGFNTENVYTMFLPNSYELYWNTSAEQFFERMHKEYQKFWTSERTAKAEAIGLSPVKVSILASIVDAEALHNDEMPIIAGLYLNRYEKGIRLQADPTVIFALQDFSIRRVLNRHLRYDSPYNTYVNAGLPPGPIMMPSLSAIDAVLNYKKHNYIYMCAKEDFSGYHNFAVTEAEHRVNARRFQEALNRMNIKK